MFASCYDVMIVFVSIDCNDTSAFERVQYWEGQLKEHEPNCAIFVVGTMFDTLPETNVALVKEREDEFATDFNIPKERFFLTSALTGVGIDELFKAVSEYCAVNVKDLKLYNQTASKEPKAEENEKKCCLIQ